MDKFFILIIKLRWWLAGLLFLTAISLLPYSTKAFVPNNSLKLWFLETDPLITHYDTYQNTFGNDEVIVILLQSTEDLLGAQALERLRQFEKEAKQIHGVARVGSILSARDAFNTEQGLEFKSVIPNLNLSPDAKERILKNPSFQGRLVNELGNQLVVFVQMATSDSFEASRDRVVTEVSDLVNTHFMTYSPALGGVGVI